MELTPTALTGSNVRAEMARLGVSQSKLAASLGISQSSLSKRLQGHTPFSIDELVTISKALDIALDRLLVGISGEVA